MAVLTAAVVVFVAAERDPWRALQRSVRRQHALPAGRLAILKTEPARHLVTRSALVVVPGQSLEIKATGYAVIASPDTNDHQKAVAAFVVGNTAEAERLLRAIPERGRSPAYWNDLAVVLAAKGLDRDDATLIEALAAADRAIADAAIPSHARFNRAMVVDDLGLNALARSAYEAYLGVDTTSPWAAEARRRLATLESAGSRTSAWERVVTTLPQAGAARTFGPITDAVMRHPEYARRWAETECLAEWAIATSRGDAAGAAAHLMVSRVMGDTLRRTKGEGLLASAVAAIDRASSDPAKLAALVTAHQLYRDASRLNGARQTVEAAELFQKAGALFAFRSSPMALLARHYYASAAVDVGHHARALTLLDDLSSEVPAGFRFLHGQMNRLRATILSFNGRFEEALAAQRSAQAAFMAIGDVPNAVEMTGRIAAALTSLGRPHEAWPIIRSSLAAAGGHGDTRVIQSLLHAAAFVALSERRWELAHALLNLELEGGGADTRLAEAAIWRALAAKNAGLKTSIAADLERARQAAASIADANFREGAENELRLTDALLTGDQAPERARSLLTDYLAVATKRGRLRRVPEVLVVRAGLASKVERFAEAESDLRLAVQMIEERRDRVERDVFRDTFLGKSSDAYMALADLLDSRGEYDAALAVADRPRARILLDREEGRDVSEPVRARDLAALVKPGTVLLAFGFYRERTVRYVITTGDMQRVGNLVSWRQVERSIERLADAIGSGEDPRARAEARTLYSLLLGPIHEAIAGHNNLVVVDAPGFARLSFASLIGPDERFLIEDATVTIIPSLRAFAAAPLRLDRRAQALLSVGNPSIDRMRYSAYPSLEAAQREANDVAALYDRATLLVAEDATKSRITAALQEVDVAHLATHAVSDPLSPDNSRILVASTGTDDSLTASEIAGMNLRHLDTVVAAGCRTATPSQGYGYSRSLSSAFLAAGARHVVASLWDVEDAAGREFSVAFHRALRLGVEPAEALRRVQLQMMRSPDRRYNTFAAWSAMQLYGAGR